MRTRSIHRIANARRFLKFSSESESESDSHGAVTAPAGARASLPARRLDSPETSSSRSALVPVLASKFVAAIARRP